MATVVRSLAALLVALALAPAVLARSEGAPSDAPLTAPSGLHAFLLRSDEPAARTHVFPRTPSFAWDPVLGAEFYEFQLSTSRNFAENAIVWEDTAKAPVLTIPLTLPWTSGARYSWYARVRALSPGEEGPWGALYAFNMRPSGAPRSLSNGANPQPGMVRWTPVDGATAYEVAFLFDLAQGKTKRVKTAATSADLREYYTLHNGPDWANVVYWRVRAVRELYGEPKNKLPVASYGPWSALNRTVEPALGTGEIALAGSISRSAGGEVISNTASGAPGPGPHQLVPGFWWTGTLGPSSVGACPSLDTLGTMCPLFRVYVYSDADCVNRVHVSDLVGSPAYVPRLTQPLKLPADTDELAKALGAWLGDGSEGLVFDAANERVKAAGGVDEEETADAEAGGDSGESAGSGDESGGSDTGASESAAQVGDRKSSLWDNDWQTGRYYWTVVPAVPVVVEDSKIEWHDVAFGQDMCASGRVMSFGKTSAAVTTATSGVPYISGMSAQGRLVAAAAAKPSFFGRLAVAWKPALGAQRYEVQWSRRESPWRTAGKLATPATSALLDLPPGRWFYRVRGLDATLPGPPGLTWSDPVEVKIVPRRFEIIARAR